MPAVLLKACTYPGGCPELTEGGPCPAHAKVREARRGSASARGYGHQWRQFRDDFKQLLIAARIMPACGAALPTGPDTKRFSQCVAHGWLTANELELDHEPPLADAERANPAAVRDPTRVGFLCHACHSRKTAMEAGGFGR